MKILVDADSLVYLVGFACQTSDYSVAILDVDRKLHDLTVVQGLDEVRAIEAQLPDGYAIETEPVVTEEPLANALGSCKTTLLAVEHQLRVTHKLSFDRMDLFLTGKMNFRDRYAKVRPYKGNREGVERPVHYEAIRAYLQRRWDAKVCHGREADDELAIRAADLQYDPARVCIVSMDKDLRTVPGRLYNFRRKTMEVITPDEALRTFYRQMLTGDATDNVLGCYKTGPKAALTIIPDAMTDERQMAAAVLTEFAASLERKGCPYALRGARDVMRETGILLHMQRHHDDIWDIPKGV